MKTAEIKLNYTLADKGRVKITNHMAPLFIGASETDQVQIKAELSIQSAVPETELDEHFKVNEGDGVLEIELQNIRELERSTFGSRSQVWIRVPAGSAVYADSEYLPLTAEDLEGELEIRNENGPIRVRRCNGDKTLHNENGPIKIRQCAGNLEAKLENGPFSGEELKGEDLRIESENGAIKIRMASFPKVEVISENGMIHYETLPVESGDFKFQNENGQVNLVVPEDFDFELDAETELGTIAMNLEAEKSLREGHTIIRKGNGENKITARTENGQIKIGTDKGGDLHFIKMKIGDIKGAVSTAVSEEDMGKVKHAMESVAAKVEKTMESVNEEKIKERVAKALGKLKASVEDFDFDDTRDKVVKAVEQAGDEVTDAMKTVFRRVKSSPEREEGEKKPDEDYSAPGVLKEYIMKAVDSAISKSKGLSASQKEEVDERSRTKILEMLESGKITAEEAERLLKAINKE